MGVTRRRTVSRRREGQHAVAPAGGGECGVGDRRADRRDARLADTGRRRARRDDMDLDARHLGDAQDPVAVEVRLSFSVMAPYKAAPRPKPMPPLWAAMTSGFMETPQSTAQTTRSTLILPSPSTVTSATWAT